MTSSSLSASRRTSRTTSTRSWESARTTSRRTISSGLRSRRRTPSSRPSSRRRVSWTTSSTIVDRDNELGVSVLIYKYEDLVDNYWDISERFQNILNTPNGQVIDGDWRIMGEAQGVRPDLGGHVHLRRSEEYGTPSATGAPSTCLVPLLSVYNIIYRDADGHLHELWSTIRGETGTTD